MNIYLVFNQSNMLPLYLLHWLLCSHKRERCNITCSPTRVHTGTSQITYT